MKPKFVGAARKPPLREQLQPTINLEIYFATTVDPHRSGFSLSKKRTPILGYFTVYARLLWSTARKIRKFKIMNRHSCNNLLFIRFRSFSVMV